MTKIPELPDIDIEELMGDDHTEWESEVALVHIYKALAAISYDLREIRKNSPNVHSDRADGDE